MLSCYNTTRSAHDSCRMSTSAAAVAKKRPKGETIIRSDRPPLVTCDGEEWRGVMCLGGGVRYLPSYNDSNAHVLSIATSSFWNNSFDGRERGNAAKFVPKEEQDG